MYLIYKLNLKCLININIVMTFYLLIILNYLFLFYILLTGVIGSKKINMLVILLTDIIKLFDLLYTLCGNLSVSHSVHIPNSSNYCLKMFQSLFHSAAHVY